MRKKTKERSYEDVHWLDSIIRESAVDAEGDHRSYERDSLDTAIDSQLMQAEKNAAVTNERRSLRAALLEADDDEGEAAPPPEKQKAPFNPEIFAGDVARIVTHATNLLDIEGTIVRRALNLIVRNQDHMTAEKVKSILERDYHVSITPESEKNDNTTDINAVGAGPELGG